MPAQGTTQPTRAMPTIDQRLVEGCARYSKDPWGFTLWAYPWGEGDLRNAWPEPWQEDVLKSIRDQLQALPVGSGWTSVIREAVAAGHGPGKSALISWIIWWAMSTMRSTRCVVTANTETQLRTKTVPEVRVWHQRCITQHWFTVTATAVFSTDKNAERNWRCDFIPWTEHRSESFAGLHNKGRRTVILFDEASAIAQSIWEVVEGALTDKDTQIVFCAFGNPTRRDGHFAKVFRELSHRWNTRHVDARTSKLTNHNLINQWIDDHGIESNFVRVRVLGQFPTADTDALIDDMWVETALHSKQVCEPEDKGILVCDVARFGEDSTVIGYRKGRTYTELEQYTGKDLMHTTGLLIRLYKDMGASHVIVDDTGLGGGVTDRLIEQNVDVRPFIGGARAYEEDRFRNRRDEAWWHLRELFRKEEITLVNITDAGELRNQLTMLNFDFASSGRIEIETKKQAKRRTKQGSPDRADAVCMAFAPDAFDSMIAGLA